MGSQINSNRETPMRISSVRVEGAKNTRQSFLGFLINPILSSTPTPALSENTPSNLESVLHTARHISHTLQQTDLFHSVEAKIEKARNVLADDGDVDIVFKAREKGRLYLNSSTELGNNEGSAVCSHFPPSLPQNSDRHVECDWQNPECVWWRRGP